MKWFALLTPKTVLFRRGSPSSTLLLALVLVCLVCIMKDERITGSISRSLEWSPESGSSLVSPLWIVPDMTSSPISSNDIPVNWTMFVPTGFSGLSSCEKCFHEQENAPYFHWIADSLESANFSLPEQLRRKMCRLLFMINHGAVGIVLTSDLATINSSLSRLVLDNQPEGVVGMVYVGSGVTSDFSHFHAKEKPQLRRPCRYMLRKRMTPILTVGVSCRMAPFATDGKKLFTKTDPEGPPVFSLLPKFSITQFSNAFVEYEGFWALIATVLPRGGDSMALWGLWVQRMLQELGGEIGLTSLPCPSHSESSTFIPSKPPDQKTKLMQIFVSEWKCDPTNTFYACAIQLVTDAVKTFLMEQTDLTILRIWLKSLQETGYSEPVRKTVKESTQGFLPGCIIYSPSTILASDEQKEHKLFPNIFPMCKNLPKRPQVPDPFVEYSLTKPSRVRDIALVIIFYDSSIYSNIRFLHDIYPKYFPHLIYCGPDWTLFYAFYKTFHTPLTYIEVPNTKGFVAYECVSRAMMMNYDVKGYLEMADDVILNPWTMGDMPRDKFWFQKDLKIANRHQQIMHDFALPYPFPWWPWTVHGQMWGAKAMAKVWNHFTDILRQPSNQSESKQIVRVFLETLRLNSGNYDNFFYCSSDIFYVPNKFRQEWSWLSEMFFKNNVFLDIAVPTLMNGMDVTKNILRMEGIYLWYNDRGSYPMHYSEHHQFLHPWKMGWIHRSDHANFLCYHFLPHIIRDRTNGTELTKTKLV